MKKQSRDSFPCLIGRIRLPSLRWGIDSILFCADATQLRWKSEMSHVPTPSQTVGPFFSIGLSALCREQIECGSGEGKRVVIRGRILDGDGQPVPDAVLEIWQASEAARGNCSEEQDAGRQKIPAGFARIVTNERGE